MVFRRLTLAGNPTKEHGAEGGCDLQLWKGNGARRLALYPSSLGEE